MELTDLKAPEPVEGRPPWQDPQWPAAAEDWIDAECARAALARTGPAQARGRPYSVVARVPTEGGTVWFKASPPAGRFEPALLAALAAWQPDRFAAPIAVDLNRAWSLTRDGGPTLREQEQSSAPDAGRWPTVLHGYARPQADLTRHSAGLLALGLPDLRPGSVPGLSPRLADRPACPRADLGPTLPVLPGTSRAGRAWRPCPGRHAQTRPPSRGRFTSWVGVEATDRSDERS